MATNENVKDNAGISTEQSTEKAAQEKAAIVNPQEQIHKLAKGKMTLETPIRAGGVDVTELQYDFSRLTGREYADAMDRDSGTMNMFRMSNKQALYLFAAAAAKETSGIDATDISDRIGVQDSIKAVQLATIFFVASARAGNSRITNG